METKVIKNDIVYEVVSAHEDNMLTIQTTMHNGTMKVLFECRRIEWVKDFDSVQLRLKRILAGTLVKI